MSSKLSSRSKLASNSKKNVPEQSDEPVVITSGCSTPTHNKHYDYGQVDRDYSPCFLSSTQECLDNVDVLWDWNSPQSNKCVTKKKKRIHNAPSPKLPLKKHMPSHNLRSFEKLKEELRAFQNEISVLKSPEAQHNLYLDDEELVCDNNRNTLDEFFNDSMEQQFVMVSQQIEKIVEKGISSPSRKIVPQNVSPLIPKPRSSPRNLLTKSFSSNMLPTESPVKKPEAKAPFNFQSKMQQLKNDSLELNDSFDMTLINLKDIQKPSAVTNVNCDKSPLNNSHLKLKTKSLSFGDHYVNTRSNIQRDADVKIKAEIEKKRLEAVAKLRARKKQEMGDSDISPIKFSPEEIEIKRRQALAKLEAKKKQEVIERNRKEALKRLEMNRMKRVQNKEVVPSGMCR